MNTNKYKKIIKKKSNIALVKYYRLLLMRLVDEKNTLKKSELEALIGFIKKEWEKRPDTAYTLKPNEGLMSTMGYRVGDTQGIKEAYRKMIMIEILTGPLPFVSSHSYMEEWGSNKSVKRFNKLKRFLIGEINLPIQRNNYRAISEWKSDLEWLEVHGMEYCL